MKSPLRYPGGKTRAIKILKNYIPDGTKEICSPFFGGGSFEFHLEDKGIKVYGYDNFDLLVNFWYQIKNNNKEVYRLLCDYDFKIDKHLFKLTQNRITKDVGYEIKAAWFYLLNRCSFSGATLSGGMSPNTPRFNKRAIDYMKDFKTNIDVKLLSFEKSIPKHDCLVFADPPYFIDDNLYGNKGDMHKGFNHKFLSETLLNRGNFILTYNDSDYIRELYHECKIDVVEWSYGMNKSKKSNEIIITL